MLGFGYSCRARFTAADLSFLIQSLGEGKASEEEALVALMADEEERQRLLDHPRLLERVLEEACLLTLSAHFYFYVLVRHLFLRHGLTSPELADYVAGVLVTFARTDRWRRTRLSHGVEKGRELYLLDWMLRLQEARHEREQFFLQLQVGDLSLYLSGVCRDFLDQRRHRRGAPDLSYYRSIGAASYRLADRHPLAAGTEGQGLLGDLADSFECASEALGEVTRRLFSDR